VERNKERLGGEEGDGWGMRNSFLDMVVIPLDGGGPSEHGTNGPGIALSAGSWGFAF